MEKTTIGRSIKIPETAIIVKQLGQNPIDDNNYKLVFQIGSAVATIILPEDALEELNAGKEITFWTEAK